MTLFTVNSWAATCLEGLTQSQEPIESPMLWSLEKEGRRSYLFGVYHRLIDPERLPAAVFEAIESAEFFVNEVDQAEEFDWEPVFAKNQTPAKDLVSPEAQETLSKMFGEQFEQPFKAFFLYMQYTNRVTQAALSETPLAKFFMDQFLYDYARSRSKQVSSLDTHADVFADYDKGVSADLLDWTVLNLNVDDFIEDMAGLVRAYTSGDIQTFNKLYREANTKINADQLNEDLIVNRNLRWLPKIDDLHQKGPSFIAVGTGHIYGPQGLLETLQARGFKIRRL